MSGTAEGGSAEEFARLLRELKDRSGLSYGALAKRLHMSTSTLHRYGQGASVPIEYAPVERLARVCRATPQELVELHRRWVLADEERRIRADAAVAKRAGTAGPGEAPAQAASAADPDQEVGSGTEPGTGAESGTGSAIATATGPGPAPDTARTTTTSPAPAGDGDPDEPVVVRVPRGPAPPRRSRTALAASAAAAAVLVTAVLVAHPLWSGGGDDATGLQPAGGVSSSGTHAAKAPSTADSSASALPAVPADSPASASVSASASAPPGVRPTREATAGQPVHTGGTLPAPFTVSVRPYAYANPCEHFLVNRPPARVATAPLEQDVPQWVAEHGAVAANDQRIALTVQGTGADTVVLEALHVDIVSKGAPLAWNDYASGGCGGDVDTSSFDVDLDSGNPVATVANGRRAFPYKVSESDPEVFYVDAGTAAHDVRWSLTLDWSSGSRHGTVRIDDDGTSFRTSSGAGRPRYECPPGGAWARVTG